ncbi:MAG: hypothetical protein N2505_00090 [Endomicrobia bacterium]|nr:hypothetical protein [Endomicrobiia bacterium]
MNSNKQGIFSLSEKIGRKFYLSYITILFILVFTALMYLISQYVTYQRERKAEKERVPQTDKIVNNIRRYIALQKTCPSSFSDVERVLNKREPIYFKNNETVYMTPYHTYFYRTEKTRKICYLWTISKLENDKHTVVIMSPINNTARMFVSYQKYNNEIPNEVDLEFLAKNGFFEENYFKEEKKKNNFINIFGKQ